MPRSGAGECVTPVLDSPSCDGLSVQAIRVYHEPIVSQAGEPFYEPPCALHSVSRDASGDVPASLVAFFVRGDGESATVYDRV